MADQDLVLALDTSTVVNVGLARDGVVIGTATVTDRMAHAEQLTPLVQRCLSEAGVGPRELTQVVVGLGPGPFTGLRVGIVTAQMLSAVLGIGLRGICSLDVVAREFLNQHATPPTGDYVVASDARRREVYWARYAADGRRVDGPRVSPPDDLPALPTVGPGADLYPDRLSSVMGPRTLDPGVLALAGPTLPDEGRSPLYLRRPDAAEPTRRKSVLSPAPPVRRGGTP